MRVPAAARAKRSSSCEQAKLAYYSVLFTAGIGLLGIAGFALWYEHKLWAADRLCRKYHFDREGDDGRSCVVEGARSADGSRTYWAVAIETAEDHEIEAINAREARSKGK